MALIDSIVKVSGRDETLIIPGASLDAPMKVQPMSEIGVTGLLRTKGAAGYVYDEFLTSLSASRQRLVYREMRDNDAVIGAMFFALEMILRRAEWRVEPAEAELVKKAAGSGDAKGGMAKRNQYADFLSENLEDMSHTFEDFIAECVSMFAFGFALFETVCKRRKGPDKNPASKYDDGRIGWRKMAPRAQESILYWIWDDEGGLQGAVQLAAPDYRTVPMPIEKLLLFRTTSIKNNPEGRSILRNVYRCFDDQTEIFTREGWKRGAELRPTDEVAVWAGSDQRFEVPSKIYGYEYEGILIHFEGNGLDQRVTPNHDVWIERESAGGFWRCAADRVFPTDHHAINQPGFPLLTVKPDKITKEPYRGLVWCVTTATGVVYTRRNGCCCWSGNSWFFKKRIEEVEGIGIERDLCGVPVLYASVEAIAAMGGNDVARRLVRNLRIDDQMGIVLPLAYDENGNQLVKLELMKAAGAKQTDPNASIQRYNSDMLNTILAGFIQLGQTPTGSFSLHMSASQIFAQAIGAFMDSVSAVINRIAVPRLLALNKMDLSAAPKLVPGEIGVRDLDQLANFVQKLSMSGLQFFDKPTADYLRKAGRLPEQPEELAGAQPAATVNTPPGQKPMPGQKPVPGQPAQQQGQPPQQNQQQGQPPRQSWGAPKNKPPQAGPKKPAAALPPPVAAGAK